MTSFRIRPRFKQHISGECAVVEDKLTQSLAEHDQFDADVLSGHINIKLNPQHRHFWSPQLNLTFEQAEDEVIIRGLYGPNPTLWAIFFFGYVSFGILFVFLGMWGFSRWSLGLPSQMLWGLPILAILALVLYVSSQAGQKIGAQQMFDIHHFYEDTVGRVHIG